MKAGERAAIFGQFPFALQDVEIDGGLILDAGGEHFLCARGNRGISRDDFGDYAAHGFDAERERRYVEQQHGLDAGIENVGLHRRAERDDFIGIQLAVRRAAEIIADGFADQRNARRAADQHDFVHVFCGELGVGQRLAHRLHRAGDDWLDEFVEFAQ